jgi:hypothetical protein
MQTSTELPVPSAKTITFTGADGKTVDIPIPATTSEIRQLTLRRHELSDQLTEMTERRSELVKEIITAPEGVTKTGLEDRVKLLDKQIIQLETDLATTGRQLSAAPSNLVEEINFETRAQQNNGDDWAEGMFAGGFGVLIPVIVISLFMRRRRKKRKTAEPAKILGADSTERLERLERGMEAIAIEIERVSEGQRFVTKLLSDSAQPVGARRIE